MVNNEERKWKHFMNPGIPQRGGKMKKNELYCFDAQFFGIHGQQAKVSLNGAREYASLASPLVLQSAIPT